MTKQLGIFALIVAAVVIVAGYGGSQQAQAFPRGSTFRNITVNPGAIPSGGLATVTVSYSCSASGCFDTGGLGQLIVKPTGIFKQVSTCSSGVLGNTTFPGSYACFNGPLSNDAIVNYGQQRLPTNQIIIPPPEPSSPELHTLQAVVEANAATPGTTLTICYQEEPVTSFGSADDPFANISLSIPPGDPPASVVDGATGVYASLCTFILVTSGAPQHITILDITSTNLGAGGRAVVRALVTDQNGNPIPGVNVTFTASDPSQATLTCTTTQDLLAAGYVFNPIYTGSYPGAAGLPSAGTVPNPGAGNQAGQTSLGSPFPLPSGTSNTIQGTPLGYTCYSGTALGGTTGLGTVPPGSITSLTDNTGVAYATLVGLASGSPGAGMVVTATVYSGGIPPTAISARSTPFIIQGAPIGNIHGVFTVNPNFISSPTNTAEVRVCFTDPNGLPAPQGLPVVFTIVDRTSGLIDSAFTQFSAQDQNEQAIRYTDANGCATVNVLATGSGTVTVAAAIGTNVVTTVISVGSEGVPSGQPGIFTNSPSSTAAVCPGANEWLGVYWQGPNTPAMTAMQACPNADRLWVRRGTTWLGAAPDQTGASDQFDIVPREFAFLHGRP